MLGNSLGTWGTYWEPIENSDGVHTLGTSGECIDNQKQSNNPTLSPTRKKKTWAAWGHAASPHWRKEIFWPTCVICHFQLGHELWVYIGNGSDPRHPPLGRLLLGRAVVGAFSKQGLLWSIWHHIADTGKYDTWQFPPRFSLTPNCFPWISSLL